MKKLLLLLLLFPTVAHAATFDNLVAYWKLDEASGNAADSFGSNTLTDNNTAGVTTGLISNCRTFNGTNESLTITDNADVSFGDEDFGISCWVYLPSSVPTTKPVLGKYDWGVGSDHSYLLWINPSSQFRFTVSNNGSTTTDVTFGTLSLSADTWYHVVVWHDATANQTGITVNDGTPVTASHTTGINDGSHAFEIGKSNSAFTACRVDEVALFAKVPSGADITALYNSGSGLTYTPTATGDPNPLTPTLPGGTPDPLKRILGQLAPRTIPLSQVRYLPHELTLAP